MTTVAPASTQPVNSSFEDWFALGEELFGPDPADWRFECPSCHDTASGRDFREALDEHPRYRKDRSPVQASDLLGQECIGRTLGALLRSPNPYTGRGCDWAAYGLFSGPVHVVQGDRRVPTFRFASTS